jgi:hypothetical protein
MDFNAEVEKIIENKTGEISKEKEALDEQLSLAWEELGLLREFVMDTSKIFGVEVDKFKIFNSHDDLKDELEKVLHSIKTLGRS